MLNGMPAWLFASGIQLACSSSSEVLPVGSIFTAGARLLISERKEKPSSGPQGYQPPGAPERPSLIPGEFPGLPSCAAVRNLLLVPWLASTPTPCFPVPGLALTHGLGDHAHPICDLLQPHTGLSQGTCHLHPYRDKPPRGKESPRGGKREAGLSFRLGSRHLLVLPHQPSPSYLGQKSNPLYSQCTARNLQESVGSGREFIIRERNGAREER